VCGTSVPRLAKPRISVGGMESLPQAAINLCPWI